MRPIALLLYPPFLTDVALCLRFFDGYVERRALGPFPNLRVGHPRIPLTLRYKDRLIFAYRVTPLLRKPGSEDSNLG